jgi:hypothetical protein
MNKGVMSDQNRGQMSSGVLKASDGQRNYSFFNEMVEMQCNIPE